MRAYNDKFTSDNFPESPEFFVGNGSKRITIDKQSLRRPIRILVLQLGFTVSIVLLTALFILPIFIR